MKRWLLLPLLVLSVCLLIGCGKQNTTSQTTLRTVTYEGSSFQVPTKPQRVVVLSSSILYMVHELGITPIARTESLDALPPALEAIPTVGHTSHVNIEALLASKPDLVIGLASQQENLVPLLKENHIPHMMLRWEGIQDNIPLLQTLGETFHVEQRAHEAIERYQHQMEAVQQQVKSLPPARVAVLFASGKSITAETPLATAASMVHLLGMQDVVAQHIPPDKTNAKYIPYSLETLTLDNPDVIFIVSMGKRSDIDAQMKKSMTDNPAWNTLRAVQNDKVFYLPSDLFLLNPGLRTPQALAELAEDAYGIQRKHLE